MGFLKFCCSVLEGLNEIDFLVIDFWQKDDSFYVNYGILRNGIGLDWRFLGFNLNLNCYGV